MALILITDGLFAFTSYSTTMEVLGVRGAFFLLVLIVTILFALFVYKPSVVTLMATAEENTVKGITGILIENKGKTEEETAKAVVAFLKNPVKGKEEEKSEE
jgi:glycosyltransferase involved in cell wall biosynthesis